MPTVNVGIFGQSIAEALNGQDALGVFKTELAREGYTPNIVFAAWGGSSALKAHARTDQPTWYWWDETTNQPGPLLTSAVATIAASPNKPQIILWLQGEQDVSPTFDQAVFANAVKNIVWKLKQASNAADPQAVAPRMDIIGHRANSDAIVQAIRDAQLYIMATSSLAFMLDKYDLRLLKSDPLGRWPNDYHFMSFDNGTLGFRAAQSVLAWLGAPAVQPPRATVFTRLSSTQLKVSFFWQGTLQKPVMPDHFAIRDGAAIRTGSDLTYTWSGDDLIIASAYSIGANATLLFPYGNLQYLNRAALITDSIGTPLLTFSATF